MVSNANDYKYFYIISIVLFKCSCIVNIIAMSSAYYNVISFIP